ncbi:hypothetical protein, variant [Phialophora macrospora]|uniref:Uncharacterized protein n=1 Tax=Phialophora macrospora TaxID=1851006 RepID=A0A0D2CLI0_9EURO|nr:hypothetical protein, variant [Phialophora macrospora]
MATLPDIGALVLVPRTNLPLTKLTEPKTFTTIPAEIRLKIYELLFIEIQVKEVSWIEEPPHAPAQGITRRQLKPFQPLAILAVNKMIRREAVGVAARCPIHLQIYGPLSHRGFQPPPPPVPRQQVQSVVTNKPFWNFDESFPYADRMQYPNISVIKLERMLVQAPETHLRSFQSTPRSRPESAHQHPIRALDRQSTVQVP